MNKILYNYLNNEIFTKILLILVFCFIICDMIIIMITPVVGGYEESVYGAFPSFFWFILLISIFLGQLIIFTRYYYKKAPNYLAILSIIVVNSILLFMPLIRGYYSVGREDGLTHIGYMKDILNLGYVGSNNIYPLDHILGVSFNLISGINLFNISMIIPILFSFLFIISFYLLFRKIFDDQNEVLIALSISSILLFGNIHVLFAPNLQAFLLIPLVLYLFFNSQFSEKQVNFSILTLIIIITAIFFHPIVGLSLIIFFSIYTILNRIKEIRIPYYPEKKSKNPLIVLLIVNTVFFAWGVYSYLLVKNIKIIYEGLFEGSISQISSNLAITSQASPEFSVLIKLIFYSYGIEIILGILSILSIIYIIRNIKNYQNKSSMLLMPISFIVFILITFGIAFTSGSIDFKRFSILALVYSLILIPATFFLFIKNNKTKIKISILFGLSICFILTFISISTLYPSSILQTDNLQVSKGEYIGMKTYFEINDPNITNMQWGITKTRFLDSIYGVEKEFTAKKSAYWYPEYPIDHLGYNNHTFIGEAYNDTRTLLLTTQGINHYDYRYGGKFLNLWRFDKNDFKKLFSDKTVSHVYSGKDLDLYYIISPNP